MNQDFKQNTPNGHGTLGISLEALVDQIKYVLSPPIFDGDVIKTRKAAILHAFLLSIILITILYMIVILVTSESPELGLALVAAVQLFTITTYVALKRGHVDVASIVFVLFLWLLLSAATVLFGNPVNPLLASLILVVFTAGQLISNRAAVLYALLSVAFAVVLHFLNQNMVLPQYLVTDDVTFISRLSIFFILMAFFSFIANRTTIQAFRQLHETEKTLTDRNQELRELQVYLEQNVEERSQQIERRNRYLEAASQVASKSISILNLNEMLDNVVVEISQKFGFYHVGIFLTDEKKEWAVLHAASSIGGKKMIARNHRLAVGRQGMVGFVTSVGQARIAQDIEFDRIHSVTPELPDTRSEMTLPLRARNQVIGALDIQESIPNAFADEDIAVLQTMTDQIALAVENIRLFEQTQESLEEVQRAYGQYSELAWTESFQKNLLPSYRYFSGAVNQIRKEDISEPEDGSYSIPVKVRGYTIGTIEISKESGSTDWNSDEVRLLEALSEQIGIALDSARLFNETQLRANTEQLIGKINSQIRETLDINSILKNTAENLRQSLSLPELTIRMTTPDQYHSSNGDTFEEENGEGN